MTDYTAGRVFTFDPVTWCRVFTFDPVTGCWDIAPPPKLDCDSVVVTGVDVDASPGDHTPELIPTASGGTIVDDGSGFPFPEHWTTDDSGVSTRDAAPLTRRYWVFGFGCYYPSGGLQDVVATFDAEPDAREFARRCHHDVVEVFDSIERVTLEDE